MVNRSVCNSWFSYLLSSSFLRRWTPHLVYTLVPSTETSIVNVWKLVRAVDQLADLSSFFPTLFHLPAESNQTEASPSTTQCFSGFWQKKDCLQAGNVVFGYLGNMYCATHLPKLLLRNDGGRLDRRNTWKWNNAVTKGGIESNSLLVLCSLVWLWLSGCLSFLIKTCNDF